MFLVSWHLKNIYGYAISGTSANKSFDSISEMEKFISANKYSWYSYTTYTVGEPHGIISELSEIRHEKT